MQIQKISVFNGYNACLCEKPNGEEVKRYAVTEPLPEDKFEPSFGAKKVAAAKKVVKKLTPLVIPEGMFETSKQAKEFSKLVEAMRTINNKNYTQKRYRDAAKVLFDEEDFFNTYAQVSDFIEANAPEIQKGERNFDEIFDLFCKALEGKKTKTETVIENMAKVFEEFGYFENFKYPV